MENVGAAMLDPGRCRSGDHPWGVTARSWRKAAQATVVTVVCPVCSADRTLLEDAWHRQQHSDGRHTDPNDRCGECHGHARPLFFRDGCALCVSRYQRMSAAAPRWIKRTRVWRMFSGPWSPLERTGTAQTP